MYINIYIISVDPKVRITPVITVCGSLLQRSFIVVIVVDHHLATQIYDFQSW